LTRKNQKLRIANFGLFRQRKKSISPVFFIFFDFARESVSVEKLKEKMNRPMPR